MNVSFEFDQDPRYGWASINVEGDKQPLIVMHDESGSKGFHYLDGEFIPTCICSAWYEHECSCPNVDWSKKDKESSGGD